MWDLFKTGKEFKSDVKTSEGCGVVTRSGSIKTLLELSSLPAFIVPSQPSRQVAAATWTAVLSVTVASSTSVMDMTLQGRVFPSISFPGCESMSTNCWMEPSLPGLGFRGRSTQTAQVQRQRRMQIKTAGHRKYTFRTISRYFVFAFYKRNPQTL
jgi:hypothetical protein